MMATSHPLKLYLYAVPVTLNKLSVDTRHWILEMKGVIHSTVPAHSC